MSTSVQMLRDVRKQLHSIEQKHKRFEQQQFTFIKALERSRDDANDKTEPVSTVIQVEKYMNHHCSNITDNYIISLFFEIMADLEEVLNLLESLSIQNTICEGLKTCRELLDPNRNISQLRAHYPHNEVNRLSCDEAWNFYGGIVSVIPLALDHLTSYCKEATQLLTSTAQETSPPQTETQDAETSTSLDKSTSNNSHRYKEGTGSCHPRKEVWKPPGIARK